MFDNYLKCGVIIEAAKFFSVFNDAATTLVNKEKHAKELQLDVKAKAKNMHEVYDQVSKSSRHSPEKSAMHSRERSSHMSSLESIERRRQSYQNGLKVA